MREITSDYFSKIETHEQAYFLGYALLNPSGFGYGLKAAMSVIHNEEEIYTLDNKNRHTDMMPITRYTGAVLSTEHSNTLNRVVFDLSAVPELIGDIACPVFPRLMDDGLTWSFVRGCMDVGHTFPKFSSCGEPYRSISSKSLDFLKDFKAFLRKHSIHSEIRENKSSDISSDKYKLVISGDSLLDFLDRIYSCGPYFRHGYHEYKRLCCKISGIDQDDKMPGTLKWSKSSPEAIMPSKARVTDAGYDLHVVKHISTNGMLYSYDTCIQIEPPFGWFFMAIPRSSIYKSGYMLANSMGVIDRTYRGSILVNLIKIDPTAPDLELPARIMQLVPMPSVHFETVERESLTITERGIRGVGSSGK